MSERAPLLLLEDETFIAIETQMTLEEGGEEEVLICTDNEEARALVVENEPRAALIDFNLGGGETSEPIARLLLDRGIPFAFLTGYTEATLALPAAFVDVPRFSKPCHGDEVLAWLQGLPR